MPLTDLTKAPFPWFGGKSQAAEAVWQLLGDPAHYCEPFFGSGAVLLRRPHPCNRAYFSETLNDKDGFVVNFWRAVQWHPEQTAAAASWPVCEADKSARQIALLRWREAGAGERLAGDAAWCDPVMAGWWAWAVCVQIGAFVDNSAWTAAPVTGCIYKQPLGTREPGVLDPITAEHGRSRLDAVDWGEYYHDLTMPELIRWFRYLSARLRHVRILNGDWSRLCTEGAMKMLQVRQGKGHVGVFLDPPYADTAERSDGLYQQDSLTVAHEAREWCLKHTNTPWLRGGMGNLSKNGAHQQHRERLWASPNCEIEEKSESQMSFLNAGANDD